MNDTRPQERREKISWLMVRGNMIVRGRRTRPQAGPGGARAAVLRGINLSGLQHREFRWAKSLQWRDAAGLTPPVIRKLCDEWNLNLVRLPVNRDWFLEGLAGAGLTGSETRRMYLDDVKSIVAELAGHGIYTLLNPHSQAISPAGARLYTSPMPDAITLDFWEAAAREFREEPAVLFDLFNEPHEPLLPPLEPVYAGLTPADPAGWISLWHEWARKMESVVHGIHPDAVLFVSGIGGPCWAVSLRSMPIPVPPYAAGSASQRHLPNTVYASHVYRYRAAGRGDPMAGVSRAPGTLGKRGFDYWFGFPELRQHHPVFVSEWGCCLERNCAHQECAGSSRMKGNAARKRWVQNLETYMRSLHACDRNGVWQGLAGWTAWSWGDHPHLVLADSQGEYQLTGFGKVVKDSLCRPVSTEPAA